MNRRSHKMDGIGQNIERESALRITHETLVEGLGVDAARSRHRGAPPSLARYASSVAAAERERSRVRRLGLALMREVLPVFLVELSREYSDVHRILLEDVVMGEGATVQEYATALDTSDQRVRAMVDEAIAFARKFFSGGESSEEDAALRDAA